MLERDFITRGYRSRGDFPISWSCARSCLNPGVAHWRVGQTAGERPALARCHTTGRWAEGSGAESLVAGPRAAARRAAAGGAASWAARGDEIDCRGCVGGRGVGRRAHAQASGGAAWGARARGGVGRGGAGRAGERGKARTGGGGYMRRQVPYRSGVGSNTSGFTSNSGALPGGAPREGDGQEACVFYTSTVG